MIKTVGIFLVGFLLTGVSLKAQLTPQEAIEKMFRGINIGNTMEAPYEGTWSGTTVQEYYFDDYVAAGFTCVRIPIRWDNYTLKTSPYTIDETWFARVEQVIDWGLSRGLILIINSHHDDWIKTSYTETNIARFDSIWSQVAERFKNKSENLLFEIINEPRYLTVANVNEINSSVLSIIRKSNPTRIVIFSGNNWSNADDLINAAVPDVNDPYLIGYYHSYDPYPFGLKGTDTFGSLSDRAGIAARFDKVKAWSVNKNIPVIISEFGANKVADYNSRMRYYKTVADEALKHGIAFAVWDDYGDFSVYQRATRKWNDIKDVLINTNTSSPDFLTLTVTPEFFVKLIWQNVTTENDSIIVQRRNTLQTGDFTTIAYLDSIQTEFVDSTTLEAEQYYYRVIAYFKDTVEMYSYPQYVSTYATIRYPYDNITPQLPDVVEAENYDVGGYKFTYYDVDIENNGGEYRTDRVDIYKSNDIYYLSDLVNDEWCEYTVNISEKGMYEVEVSASSVLGGGKCRLIFANYESILYTIPQTGSETSFVVLKDSVFLNAGVQKIKFYVVSDSNPYALDKFNFIFKHGTGINEASLSDGCIIGPNPCKDKLSISVSEGVIKSVSINSLLNCVYKADFDNDDISVDVSGLSKGVYLVTVNTNTTSFTKEIIIH